MSYSEMLLSQLVELYEKQDMLIILNRKWEVIMNKANELGTESVLKLLVKFSIPAIIGMLVNVLYGIVDRIFVGRGLGSLALSGVAVTFPIITVIMAFGMLAGVGAGAAVSIKLGQNKKEEAEDVLGNALSLLILLSIGLTIFGLVFLYPILRILGASPEIMPYAKQFAFVIILGATFQNICIGLNNIIRAEGNPRIAMLTLLIGAGINFVANPVFIFVLKLGVMGSALATLIASIVASVWTIIYFTNGKSLLKLRKNSLKLDKEIIKQIVAIGMSAFVMQLAASLATLTFNIELGKYGGDIAIGAMAIVTSVAMLVLMPMMGISQGAQPIIGYNYGAKDYGRVKQALKYAIIGTTAITTIGFIFIELFPTQIISMFNNTDANLISIGSKGLPVFHMVLPIIGVTVVGAQYFTSVGKAKLSTFLGLLRQVLILIPLILILPKFYGVDGVWIAQPVADIITTIVTVAAIIVEMKRLNGEEEQCSEKNENIA